MNEYRDVRQSFLSSSLCITLILGFHRFDPVHDSLGLLVNPIVTSSFHSSCSFATVYPTSQSPILWVFSFRCASCLSPGRKLPDIKNLGIVQRRC